MSRSPVRRLTAGLLLCLALSGCATGEDAAPPDGGAGGTTAAPPETTRAPMETTGPASGGKKTLDITQIASASPGQGPKRPRAVVASSMPELTRALGGRAHPQGLRATDGTTPESGEGAYLAVFWGEKRTGGYSVSVESASLERGTVEIRLVLEEPPPGAIVTQALTYPYAIAVVRGVDPGDQEFILVDQNGRGLDWPVRKANV